MGDDFDPATLSWVLDKQSLSFLLEAVATTTECVVDLETTGLDEYAVAGTKEMSNGGYPARIALASLTLPQEDDAGQPTTWVVPLSHPDSPWSGRWRKVWAKVAVAIRDAGCPVTNHNVKFDVRWTTAHTGVNLAGQIAWDTQIGAHLIDENASTKLKEVAPRIFDVERWDDFDLSTPGAAERVPLFDLGVYAARDTYWTWRLAAWQREAMNLINPQDPDGPEELEFARLGRLATWCAMPTTPSLTSVEQRGIRLDTDWVRSELAFHLTSADDLKLKLAGRYVDEELHPADASFAPTSNWFKRWAEIAVQRGDLKIMAMTGNGNPQWNKAVLVRLARRGHDVAQDLLDFRSHVKKAEYLTSWLHHASPQGFVHTTYHAGRVVTGRLSSSGPNMQQVTQTLKAAFIPRTASRVFIELDYSQVELRVAAFISRCEPMIKAFQEGKDLHRMLAAAITGKDESDVTPVERQGGKSANFGLLFTMGAFGFREYAETVYGVSFTMEEAENVHRTFYEMWEGIGAWHQRTLARATATGQVVSPVGRVRRVPDIHSPHDGTAGMAFRAAVNSPVQGFGSDIMQTAAASIGGHIPGIPAVAGADIVATVHDSITVECERFEWERVAQECLERMTTGVLSVLRRMDCEMDVPITVEGKVGTRWGSDDVGKVAA